jgi:hypothetical protein
MGIFDALTGDPVHAAQDSTRNYLGTLQNNLAGASNIVYPQAGNLLKDAYGNAQTNLGTGYGAATGAINQGAGSALDYLGQGNTAAQGTLQANGGAYQPLTDLAGRYGQGAGLYADALGINGAGGNQRATGAFQAGPGYEFALNQGIDAVNRRANAGGMLQGGNANRSAIDYATGLANKEYGGWLDRLSGYNNLELGATQGAAAGNQANNLAIAGLQNTGGQNKAQIATGQAGNLADIARSYYGGLAGLDTAGGTAQAGNLIGGRKNIQDIGLNIAPHFTNTYQRDADADMAASKNTLGLGMSLASLAAGGLGSMGGGGGLGLSDAFKNNRWGY